MQTNTTLLLPLAALLALSACNQSAGVKKDLLTGLTVNNKNLSYQAYELTANKEPLRSKTVYYGEQLGIKFTGVNGFKEEQGKVYPAMSMMVTDAGGKTIVSYKDLLVKQAADGIDPVKAATLEALLALGPPSVKEGVAYRLNVRIWDRKSSGVITASLPLAFMEQKEAGITVTPQGLTVESTYLIAERGRVKNHEVSAGGKVGMVFAGLKTFVVEKGRSYPGGEITVMDAAGKIIYRSDDLFASQVNGVAPVDAGDIRLTLSIPAGQPSAEYTWKFRVWDKKSHTAIEATVPLQLK